MNLNTHVSSTGLGDDEFACRLTSAVRSIMVATMDKHVRLSWCCNSTASTDWSGQGRESNARHSILSRGLY